jgi:enamine deaminase RidA (YjgF/YER057c/UK114 family)
VGRTSPSNPTSSLGDQVRIALGNVDTCLGATGVTKSEIISVRQYLVNFTSMSAEDQNAGSDACMERWNETERDNLLPPLTLTGVDSAYRDDCLFEVEGT